jgi:hypothetical protein
MEGRNLQIAADLAPETRSFCLYKAHRTLSPTPLTGHFRSFPQWKGPRVTAWFLRLRSKARSAPTI